MVNLIITGEMDEPLNEEEIQELFDQNASEIYVNAVDDVLDSLRANDKEDVPTVSITAEDDIQGDVYLHLENSERIGFLERSLDYLVETEDFEECIIVRNFLKGYKNED